MKRPNRKRAKLEAGPSTGAISYEQEFCSIAEVIFKLEGTEEDVAEALNVELGQVRAWKSKYPEFAQACLRGRSAVNTGAQRSFFRRAVGYDHVVEKPLFSEGRSYVEPCREHVPPDFGSCRTWLINRRPEKWKKLGSGQDEKTLGEALRDLFDDIAPNNATKKAAVG